MLDDADGREPAKCASEEDVYELLGLAYIEPELRENRGELEAAANGELPKLVELKDVKGELHSHTVASDGKKHERGDGAGGARAGLKYLVITDHSASMGFGADVSPSQLKRQIERIRKLNEEIDGLELLIGSEVNILPDGSLDYEDDLLTQLDWVIGSVHTSFRLPEEEQTQRIVAACEHPWVDCIGHLTGRKIERRPPYALNVEQVSRRRRARGRCSRSTRVPTAVTSTTSTPAPPRRRRAIVINTDAHKPTDFDYRRYGVATARRAWLTKKDIANTRTWKQFAPLRKRAKTADRPLKGVGRAGPVRWV